MARGIASIATYFLGVYVLAIILTQVMGFGFATSLLGIYLLLALILLFINLPILKDHWSKIGEISKSLPGFIIKMALWGMFGVFIITAVTYLLTTALGIEGGTKNQDQINLLVKSMPSWITFLVICVLAPFSEELVFRQSLIGWVHPSRKLGMKIAVAFSICVFAVVHASKFTEFISYLPISIFVTFFYMKYKRNIWASFFLHVAYNSILFMILMSALKMNVL